MSDAIAGSTKADKRNYGPHIALLLANMAWGIMSPISKNLLMGGLVSPLALSAIRIAASALLFVLCALLLPASIAPREKIARNDWPKLLLASILMISANQGLFILGIGYTNPIDSAVMSSLTPMLTMLLAALILGFAITRMKFIGVAVGLTGVVMLVWGTQSSEQATAPLLGDALCFAAQLCAALYYVTFSGLIKRYHPFTLMKWMFILSAVTYVPCCIPVLADVPFASLGIADWLSIAYIVVFATCLSYLTLPYAQRSLKPTVVSIYNYFQPLFAALVAVMLGVGTFGTEKVIATALIFLGVYFVSNNSPGRKPQQK